MARADARATLALLALALAGCTRTHALELPTEPGARTILAFQGEGGALVPATVADPSPLQVVLEEDALALVFLSSPLDALQLNPGQVTASAGDEGTPIPAVLATYTLDDAEGSSWTRSPGLASALANFRLPRIDAGACLAAGRCYGVEGEEQLRCVDCFAPTNPASPEPPMQPVFWPCPVGWDLVQTATKTPGVCQALLGGPRGPNDCGSDQIVSLALTGCAAHGPSCPAGDWPTPLPIADRYIGPPPAGAPGPVHATLAEALAAASPGEHWLVAPGVYDLPDLGLADLIIEGSCVTGTELRLAANGRVSAAGDRIVRASLSGGTLALDAGAGLTLETARVVSATISVAAGASLDMAEVSSSSTSLQVSGHLLLDRSVLSNHGPVATGAGARVEVRDSILRLDPGQEGVSLDEGATLELEASLILGPGVGVYAGPASSVDMTAVEMRGVALAVHAEDGAHLTVSKLFLNGSSAGGILGMDSDLDISDSFFREVGVFDAPVTSAIDWGSRQGTCAPEGVHVKAERLYIDRVTASGLLLLCASLEGNDLEIAHIGSQSFTLLGSQAHGTRWASRDSLNAAILTQGVMIPAANLFQTASLQLSSLDVRRHNGEGVYVLQDADVSLDAVKVDQAQFGGFVLIGGQIKLVATNVDLQNIGPLGRGAAVTAEGPTLDRLGSIEASISGFEIEKSVLGVLIRGQSSLSLSQGYFRQNGTVFQIENGLDPRQLLRGVRLERNLALGL